MHWFATFLVFSIAFGEFIAFKQMCFAQDLNTTTSTLYALVGRNATISCRINSSIETIDHVIDYGGESTHKLITSWILPNGKDVFRYDQNVHNYTNNDNNPIDTVGNGNFRGNELFSGTDSRVDRNSYISSSIKTTPSGMMDTNGWLLNINEMQISKSHLGHEDEGLYTCSVFDKDGGSDPIETRLFHLFVIDPPRAPYQCHLLNKAMTSSREDDAVPAEISESLSKISVLCSVDQEQSSSSSSNKEIIYQLIASTSQSDDVVLATSSIPEFSLDSLDADLLADWLNRAENKDGRVVMCVCAVKKVVPDSRVCGNQFSFSFASLTKQANRNGSDSINLTLTLVATFVTLTLAIGATIGVVCYFKHRKNNSSTEKPTVQTFGDPDSIMTPPSLRDISPYSSTRSHKGHGLYRDSSDRVREIQSETSRASLKQTPVRLSASLRSSPTLFSQIERELQNIELSNPAEHSLGHQDYHLNSRSDDLISKVMHEGDRTSSMVNTAVAFNDALQEVSFNRDSRVDNSYNVETSNERTVDGSGHLSCDNDFHANDSNLKKRTSAGDDESNLNIGVDNTDNKIESSRYSSSTHNRKDTPKLSTRPNEQHIHTKQEIRHSPNEEKFAFAKAPSSSSSSTNQNRGSSFYQLFKPSNTSLKEVKKDTVPTAYPISDKNLPYHKTSGFEYDYGSIERNSPQKSTLSSDLTFDKDGTKTISGIHQNTGRRDIIAEDKHRFTSKTKIPQAKSHHEYVNLDESTSISTDNRQSNIPTDQKFHNYANVNPNNYHLLTPRSRSSQRSRWSPKQRPSPKSDIDPIRSYQGHQSDPFKDHRHQKSEGSSFPYSSSTASRKSDGYIVDNKSTLQKSSAISSSMPSLERIPNHHYHYLPPHPYRHHDHHHHHQQQPQKHQQQDRRRYKDNRKQTNSKSPSYRQSPTKIPEPSLVTERPINLFPPHLDLPPKLRKKTRTMSPFLMTSQRRKRRDSPQKSRDIDRDDDGDDDSNDEDDDDYIFHTPRNTPLDDVISDKGYSKSKGLPNSYLEKGNESRSRSRSNYDIDSQRKGRMSPVRHCLDKGDQANYHDQNHDNDYDQTRHGEIVRETIKLPIRVTSLSSSSSDQSEESSEATKSEKPSSKTTTKELISNSGSNKLHQSIESSEPLQKYSSNQPIEPLPMSNSTGPIQNPNVDKIPSSSTSKYKPLPTPRLNKPITHSRAYHDQYPKCSNEEKSPNEHLRSSKEFLPISKSKEQPYISRSSDSIPSSTLAVPLEYTPKEHLLSGSSESVNLASNEFPSPSNSSGSTMPELNSNEPQHRSQAQPSSSPSSKSQDTIYDEDQYYRSGRPMYIYIPGRHRRSRGSRSLSRTGSTSSEASTATSSSATSRIASLISLEETGSRIEGLDQISQHADEEWSSSRPVSDIVEQFQTSEDIGSFHEDHKLSQKEGIRSWKPKITKRREKEIKNDEDDKH